MGGECLALQNTAGSCGRRSMWCWQSFRPAACQGRLGRHVEALCVRCTALEHVCLASCRRVTDVGMAVLTALPALRRVTLSRCPAVSEVCGPLDACQHR